MASKYSKLSIVTPVYNEEPRLTEVLDRILSRKFGLELELVIVNDASTDGSIKLIEKFAAKDKRIKVLENDRNLGKSQSVKKGILATTGDLVVINDADLEYDPGDLHSFIERFQNSDVDVIYGNRFAVPAGSQGRQNKVIYPKYWLGNTFLSFFSALFTGPRAHMWPRDMHCCYKMAKGNIYRQLAAQIKSVSSFGFDTEITIRFSKFKQNGRHLKFEQLPVHYNPRSFAEGKKLRADTDGLKAFWEIVRFNLFEK